MFKVMIVEDEPPILRMIRFALEAADRDFVVTKCAGNGKSAMQAFETEDFDVVFTDIKMPLVSGIELAGWIYENKPGTRVVMLSGYSDFEYARKALEYRVFDYLLKPVSKDKLAEVLTRIKKEADKSRARQSISEKVGSSVVILLCAGTYLLYGAEVMQPGQSFWSDERIEKFMAKNLSGAESYIYFNENNQSERYVIVEAQDEQRQTEIAHKLYLSLENSELPITMVYSTEVMLKHSGATFPKLREQLIKNLIPGVSQIICCSSSSERYENIEQPYTKKDIDEMVSSIRGGKADEIKGRFTALMNTMRGINSTQEEINGLLNIILDTYMLNYPKHMERKNTSVKREFSNALAGFVSYDSFIEDVVSIFMSFRSDAKNPDRYVKLADDVEAYLIRNYSKNITNNLLSKEFGFVPSYISRIFKRQKGVSPGEYVTRYRIELAKRLILEDSDMRIKDIADAVGFKEAYYFSKTFKRETGMWPTEFSAANSGHI